ncbi:uncharacterized protein K452DRAFT_317255 [Aplosporella prunicola CBS 121167]|uniref:Myb-like DNA-binding domain-containing protein n=1 Tax=Aplosporella prunicola CBS 121167 TaxID=1176127 RepID=A0A6A6BI47_9PEZI|nr:uncharacterized protein K452DRAFT_317255 [Aplosporella prunicola CBS 121167]KAF2143819.1 hypothetical protein K452DRAFT_317255 [Aplosporella prunicola CBS 121167]
MPTDTDNVKFLLLCMEHGGASTTDHAAVAAALNITAGASNKRLSRLRIAAADGKPADKAAVEFLYQCYKASNVGKVDHKAVGEAFDIKPGASSKRFSRLKDALEKGNYSGTGDKGESKGTTSAKGKGKSSAATADGNDTTPTTKAASASKRKRANVTDTDDEETSIKPETADDVAATTTAASTGRKKTSSTQKQSASKKQKTSANKSEATLDTKPKRSPIKREEEEHAHSHQQAKPTTRSGNTSGYEADESSATEEVDVVGVPAVPPNTAAATAFPTPTSTSEDTVINTYSADQVQGQSHGHPSHDNNASHATSAANHAYPNAPYTSKAPSAYANSGTYATAASQPQAKTQTQSQTQTQAHPRAATTSKKAALAPHPVYHTGYSDAAADPRRSIDYPQGAGSVYPRRHSLADAFRGALSERGESAERAELDAAQQSMQQGIQYEQTAQLEPEEPEEQGFFADAFAAGRVVVGDVSSESSEGGGDDDGYGAYFEGRDSV